jgi:hypothetical protein
MTKNNFFALHWLQVYWHINHIRRCDTLWNNIINARINEISTPNYRYMLQHKLYHRSNQKFDSTNWSLNTWTKTYHSWCRHQNTVWRHTRAFQTNVHMIKLGFHATFRTKNTFFPNYLPSNDVPVTGQSISQRGWAIAKVKDFTTIFKTTALPTMSSNRHSTYYVSKLLPTITINLF